MLVKDLVKEFDLSIAAGKNGLDREVMDGYCGDLLSEIMGNAPAGCAWMTVQGHQNVMNVAQMREMAAVVLTNGIVPDDETRQRAEDFGIPLIIWQSTSYDFAVKLSAAGIPGSS